MTRPSSSGPLSLLLGCLLAVLTTTAPAVDQTVNFTDGTSSSTNYTILNGADTLTLNIGSGTATYTGTIDGQGSLIKTGAGTLALTAASGYSGFTVLNGGTLALAFGPVVSSFILPGSAAITAGNATLKISNSGAGNSFQGLNFITVQPYSAASLVMGANTTLALNNVTLGSQSAVYIDASAGGVIAPASGTSNVLLLGAPDTTLVPTVLMKDAAGFGLTEVFSGRLIRATDTTLLPSTGADASTNYLINNNAFGAAAAGSSSLQIMATESAASITVDTTARAGSLEIRAGLTLYNNIWNFGGVGSNAYSITGGGAGSGLSPTLDGSLQINNYNTAPITISAPILDNGTNELVVEGSGTLILTSTSTLAATKIVGGTVVLDAGGSFNNTSGTLAVGLSAGDNTSLNMLNGSVQVHDVTVGAEAGSHGTLLVQRGQSFRDMELGGTLTVGAAGTGVMDINGGHVLSYDGQIASQAGSTGTVTVQNGGEWLMSRNLAVGTAGGIGTLNLISGRMDLNEGGGLVTLGSGSTINYGLGGSTGYIGAGSITGTDLTSVVNFNFSADGDGLFWIPSLQGTLSVVKSGSGLLMFDSPQTYTGSTTVNGGVLNVVFGVGGTPILNASSTLVLGGGGINFIGSGTQTLNGLTTTAGTGSALLVSASDTVNLGALTAGANSALNFNTAQGGNSGSTVGSSIITLTGQTAGLAIGSGFTVQDSTGFGLATVNASGQVVRMATSNLLPSLGAAAGTDYLIDNHAGIPTDPGNSALVILANETARSITVDSTQSTGQLFIFGFTALQTDVWNFGGSNEYEIASAGADSFSGIRSATPGAVMQMNNYNSAAVTISGSILENGGSGLQVNGTGFTNLNGLDNYTGPTTLTGGYTSINGDHTLATGVTNVMSGAYLGGTGTLGGDIQVQQGGTLLPGGYLSTGVTTGTLFGTTATFQPGSIFNVTGLNGSGIGTLQLSGAVRILAGSYLSIYFDNAPTANSYTLMTATGGGLDGTTKFTLMSDSTVPAGYRLAYTGNTLQLFLAAPATAFWTGATGAARWSEMNNGSTNWATTVDGTTDTNAVPGSTTDVTFSANTAANSDTILDTNYTINSLTVNTATSITDATGTPDAFATLTVNTITSINAQLAVNAGATLNSIGALTVSSTGTLAGSGTVQVAQDQSMYINGAISVGNPTLEAAGTGQQLSLTTSGTGAIVMGTGSVILVDLYSGAGAGDNTANAAAADQLNLTGKLDANAGGTLVIRNPNSLTTFSAADKWQVVNLNGGAGSIAGTLAVDASALPLAAAGFSGTFDSTTGIFSFIDRRPELSTISGLNMAFSEIMGIIAAAQTATTDVNGHLFGLRNSGDDDEASDGSISAALDYGVVSGQGDGPENPIARRSHDWQVFASVNYGNVRLSPINAQAGVQVDSWASSVGIEQRLTRGLTLGFAATFLQSRQNYTNGLGSMDLEGPTLSTYFAYARKGVWASLMYSFGDYDLGSFRNPGFGLPVANGGTTAYVNSVQFNTGYNFRFQNNTFITGPFIGIDYLHGSVDAYSETGGGVGALAFAKQSFDSLVARIGWSAAKKIQTNWAEITPQFRVSYERQNIHSNGTSVQSLIIPFSATGGNQMPGRDYMVIGGGINFQLTPAFSILLNYQTQIFRDNMTSHFGSIRVGYKF